MEPRPSPWGLRGDPILFDAMCAVFAGHPLPANAEGLQYFYLKTFEKLTGADLTDAPDHIPVDWTKRENGGMSSGLVSRDYWRDRMLPELLRRFEI